LAIDKNLINFTHEICKLPRHLISDGFDKALDLILRRAEKAGLSTTVYSFPTGYDCGTWVIPPKWGLRRVVLKDRNRNTLIDSQENGLACMSYSQPFEGWISRNELLKHLHTHPNLPDATPFVFSYYKKEWGLCCPQTLKDQLNDREYYVKIDSEFSEGHLKVGEIILDGTWDDSFLLASHLCHPHQINDGPIGAVLGIEVLKALREKGTNYSYHLLVVPENIGSAAWIQRNRNFIRKITAGLFVEMLTLDIPFVLNRSLAGNTIVDKLFEEIVVTESASNRCERFNYGNDERQFNGPNINIPMLALHRSNLGREQKSPWETFPEYHSDKDNMDLVSLPELDRSYRLIYEMLSKFDDSLLLPEALFQGEPFLSRFDLYPGVLGPFNKYMDVVTMASRNKTICEISEELLLDYTFVKKIFDTLKGKDLITYRPYSRRSSQTG
jgi:aminopeptidase-like protein|tara:strand:+ start:5198 stop:6520 length:1323 start_codon:yes stop_codon:yes gene_type:complete